MSKVIPVRDANLEQVRTCFEEKPAVWRDSVIPSERDGQPTRRAEKGHVGKLYFFAAVVQVQRRAQACNWVQIPFLSMYFGQRASSALGGCLQLNTKGKTTTTRQPKSSKVVAVKLLNLKGFDNLTTSDNLTPIYTHTRTCARYIPTRLFLVVRLSVGSGMPEFKRASSATTAFSFACQSLVGVVKALKKHGSFLAFSLLRVVLTPDSVQR